MGDFMDEKEGRGIIESIKEKKTKSGEKYLALTIDGERYSLWDKDYFNQIQEGDLVTYKWKQSGNFKKITEIERIENPELDLRERKLIRMGCLKYATELISGLNGFDVADRISYTIEAAQVFEKYVMALIEEAKEEKKQE